MLFASGEHYYVFQVCSISLEATVSKEAFKLEYESYLHIYHITVKSAYHQVAHTHLQMCITPMT